MQKKDTGCGVTKGLKNKYFYVKDIFACIDRLSSRLWLENVSRLNNSHKVELLLLGGKMFCNKKQLPSCYHCKLPCAAMSLFYSHAFCGA